MPPLKGRSEPRASRALRAAAVDDEFAAGVFLQRQVDDASDGIRTVLRRSAVAQHLDAGHRRA